jgi:dTDP-4-dehydrorhamnose reductase
MKILVFGCAGMLGHVVARTLAEDHEVFGTVRDSSSARLLAGHIDESKLLTNVTVNDLNRLNEVFELVNPDIVVNCIGLLKHPKPPIDSLDYLEANAAFPHRLRRLCEPRHARLIHISTDCVFSGAKGNYTESDVADASDLYGRTKLLGEVAGPRNLTLRTSMIGRELSHFTGLLEWFIQQRGGRIRGFVRALFSGWTTPALSRVIALIVRDHPGLDGLWHVAAEPISKYDLLRKLNERLRLDVEIDRDETFLCDRRLNGARFREATGILPPSWDQMIDELAADATPYSRT